MKIHELPAITQRAKKRVGRGYGSGKGGHTVGRGQKGQKTRGKIYPLFEGTKTKKSLIQRLPLLRGKGRLKQSHNKPVAISLGKLNVFSDGAVVDIGALIKAGLLEDGRGKPRAKIIGGGKLSKKLAVEIAATRGAMETIKTSGGTVKG